MKKYLLAASVILFNLVMICSCSDNKTEVKSAYNVELTVITPENAEKPGFVNPFKKLGRKIDALFSNTDDPSVLRHNKVMEKYEDEKIIRIAVASSWEKNVTDAYSAVMMAVNEINAEGGIADAKIELVVADDKGSVEHGTRTAYKLASDQEIFAVVGHAYSDITTPASLIYNYYGMLMFTPISSSNTITRQKDSSIFRNIQSDSEHGKTAADFCFDKGWNSIAILYLDQTMGQNMANAFELECGINGTSIATRDSYTLRQTESEYKNLFKKWKTNYKFDAVFVIGNMPHISGIVKNLREAGITQPVVGSDSFDDPLIAEIFGDTENHRLFAVSTFNNESTNPAYLEFVEKFEKAYGHKPDQEGVQWYDAFTVLATAINMAGEPSLDKVVSVLRNNTWSELADPYTFDDHGNVVGKPLTVKELSDGEFKIVK